MTIEIKGIEGDALYRWYDLAQGTAEGHSVEYNQFIGRFLEGSGAPASTLGVAGSFYVDTDEDAQTLYFKREATDTDPDTWISIASGSGGGTALTVENIDNIDTINVAGGLTAMTSSADPAGTVTLRIDNPTFDDPIQNSTAVVVNVNPGIGSFTLPAATTSLAGLMTGADKTTLDGLNTYDLSVNANGGTGIPAPSVISVTTSGNRISATADDTTWFDWTPTDPSTGRFAEEVRVVGSSPDDSLPEDGMVRAVVTGFVGGIELPSIPPTNPVTTARTICLLYTSPSPRDRQKSRMPSSA